MEAFVSTECIPRQKASYFESTRLHLPWSGDMVRCFWGAVTPGEIDNPGRILEAHQFTELHSDPSGIGDEVQGSLCQNVTTVHSDPMQGVSQDQAKTPRPASSIYSRSGRSPSPPTSPQYKATVDGEEWSEGTFIDSYQSREGRSKCWKWHRRS